MVFSATKEKETFVFSKAKVKKLTSIHEPTTTSRTKVQTLLIIVIHVYQ